MPFSSDINDGDSSLSLENLNILSDDNAVNSSTLSPSVLTMTDTVAPNSDVMATTLKSHQQNKGNLYSSDHSYRNDYHHVYRNNSVRGQSNYRGSSNSGYAVPDSSRDGRPFFNPNNQYRQHGNYSNSRGGSSYGRGRGGKYNNANTSVSSPSIIDDCSFPPLPSASPPPSQVIPSAAVSVSDYNNCVMKPANSIVESEGRGGRQMTERELREMELEDKVKREQGLMDQNIRIREELEKRRKEEVTQKISTDTLKPKVVTKDSSGWSSTVDASISSVKNMNVSRPYRDESIQFRDNNDVGGGIVSVARRLDGNTTVDSETHDANIHNNNFNNMSRSYNYRGRGRGYNRYGDNYYGNRAYGHGNYGHQGSNMKGGWSNRRRGGRWMDMSDSNMYMYQSYGYMDAHGAYIPAYPAEFTCDFSGMPHGSWPEGMVSPQYGIPAGYGVPHHGVWHGPMRSGGSLYANDSFPVPPAVMDVNGIPSSNVDGSHYPEGTMPPINHDGAWIDTGKLNEDISGDVASSENKVSSSYLGESMASSVHPYHLVSTAVTGSNHAQMSDRRGSPTVAGTLDVVDQEKSVIDASGALDDGHDTSSVSVTNPQSPPNDPYYYWVSSQYGYPVDAMPPPMHPMQYNGHLYQQQPYSMQQPFTTSFYRGNSNSAPFTNTSTNASDPSWRPNDPSVRPQPHPN